MFRQGTGVSDPEQDVCDPPPQPPPPLASLLTVQHFSFLIFFLSAFPLPLSNKQAQGGLEAGAGVGGYGGGGRACL